MMGLFQITVSALVLLAWTTSGANLHGVVDTLESWRFIDRFCFRGVDGADSKTMSFGNQLQSNRILRYHFKFNEERRPYLFIYWIDFSSWLGDVFPDSIACSEKSSHATKAIPLYENNEVNAIQISSRAQVNAEGTIAFTTRRSSFVFIVVADCILCNSTETCIVPILSQNPVSVEYTIELRNGDTLFTKHFSADEDGILLVDTILWVQQLAAFLVSLRIRQVLLRRRKYHHTAKMLVYSVWMQLVALCIFLGHYVRYAYDGVGSLVLLNIAELLSAYAYLLISWQLILLAKGLTIVKKKISATGRVNIAIFMTFLTLATLFVQIYRAYGYDRARITFVYQTTPGLVICMSKIFLLFWFCRSVRLTYINFEDKRIFYRKFAFTFTIWLALFPIMIGVTVAVPAIFQTLFAHTWEMVLLTIGQWILMFLYYPYNPWNKNFPFHAYSSVALGITAPPQFADLKIATTDRSSFVDDTDGISPSNSSTARRYSAGVPVEGQGDVGEVFEEIRTAGSQLVQYMWEIPRLSNQLSLVLRDWDGEDEGDVSYDPSHK